MMRTRVSAGLFLLALGLAALAFPPRVTGQDYEPDAPRTMLYGALAGVQIQGQYEAQYRQFRPNAELKLLSLGWGRAERQNGIMLAARVLEVTASPWTGDYMFSLGIAPVYVYATQGVSGRARTKTADLYGFFGGSAFVPYNMPYLQIGFGAKWRYYVLSPEVSLRWRSQWLSGSQRTDVISLNLGFELGGWWRLGQDPDQDE
jgi:hypothetical protein